VRMGVKKHARWLREWSKKSKTENRNEINKSTANLCAGFVLWFGRDFCFFFRCVGRYVF